MRKDVYIDSNKTIIRYMKKFDDLEEEIEVYTKFIFLKENIKRIEKYKRNFENDYEQYKKGLISKNKLMKLQNGYIRDGVWKIYDNPYKTIITYNLDKFISLILYKNNEPFSGTYTFNNVTSNYVNGIKSGIETEYYKDKLIRKTNFIEGLRDGKSITFKNDEIYNGSPFEELNYIKGHISGTGCVYYSNGNIMCETNYNDGEIIEEKWFDKEGNLIEKFTDENDMTPEIISYLYE